MKVYKWRCRYCGLESRGTFDEVVAKSEKAMHESFCRKHNYKNSQIADERMRQIEEIWI